VNVLGRIASGLLVTVMLAGCAAEQLAAPAPTPPPTRSIAVAPKPAAPPSSVPPASPEVPQGLASPPVSGGAPPVTAPPAAPSRTTPPAATPPTAPAAPPAPPSRVLSTAVDDEQRMRRDAQSRIEGTERLMRDIDRTKLVAQQEESFQTIQSFLSKAKEALSAHDLQRAYTLADKAYVLAGELTRGVSPR
jgi:hypothetical protein